MIAVWIGLPLAFRLALVALLGLAGGALANHLVYRFAYFNPRPISPWGPAPAGGPPRQWSDRIPLLGWLRLRRETPLHGPAFWVRPLLIEGLTAALFVWLYWYQTQQGGLLPESLRVPRFFPLYEPTATRMFAAHAILAVLMIAATFIDFDELTIPDVITVPGTILAVLIASFTLDHFLPTALPVAASPVNGIASTTFDSPWYDRPSDGLGARGLWTSFGIWSLWCFALADRRWSAIVARRRGWRRAFKHFVNGLFHYGFWKVLAAMWVFGLIGISLVWNLGLDQQRGLFTALMGLAVGGGVIWAIRIVASLALGKEAMGFGDVTLMAMIGAFVGWQAALLAFFLSPFTALFIVVARYLATRDPYTPYGPYLCAGTALTIVSWDGLYNQWLAPNFFVLGNVLVWLCLALLGVLMAVLFVWRLVKQALPA